MNGPIRGGWREIRQVAGFLAKRLEQTGTWSRNMILLGDFNIFDKDSPTFTALTDAGFTIPNNIQSLPVTNVGSKPRKYDQIAFSAGRKSQCEAVAGRGARLFHDDLQRREVPRICAESGQGGRDRAGQSPKAITGNTGGGGRCPTIC